jgi:hypothetical protein
MNETRPHSLADGLTSHDDAGFALCVDGTGVMFSNLLAMNVQAVHGWGFRDLAGRERG